MTPLNQLTAIIVSAYFLGNQGSHAPFSNSIIINSTWKWM